MFLWGAPVGCVHTFHFENHPLIIVLQIQIYDHPWVLPGSGPLLFEALLHHFDSNSPLRSVANFQMSKKSFGN